MASGAADRGRLDEIRQRLERRLADYMPELGGMPATLQLSGCYQRAYSDLYLFEVARRANDRGFAGGLAVKIFVPRNGARELAQSQYDALTSTWPAFACSETLSLPRPLDFFPDLCAIVTEKIQGESLERAIRRIPAPAARWLALNGGAGRWLRRFHDATALPPRPLDAGDKLRGLESNLRRLEEYGISPYLCRLLKTSAEVLGEHLSTMDLKTASVHGDFTVDNVLADGARIIALDLGGRDRNAVYHDIASYLNSLALIRLSWPVSRSLLGRARDAFLGGYFGHESHDVAAVDFLRTTGLASVALEILGRRRGQPLAAWWARRFFERRFRELVAGQRT